MSGCATKAARAERLLLAGCREKRISQPVGFLLAGSADSRRHVSRFVGAQTHRKDHSKSVLLRHSRASHFLSHAKQLAVNKNRLTAFYLSFTNSAVLRFKTEPFQQSARTSLER